MSNCSYYTCFKGKPKCLHPTEGNINSKNINIGDMSNSCARCLKRCNGIYPSQLPKANQSDWAQDILDKNGRLII